MNKPNNPKCNTCFVTNNILRCFNCKHKTKEWELKNIRLVMMRGEKDLYKQKAESKEEAEKEAHTYLSELCPECVRD